MVYLALIEMERRGSRRRMAAQHAAGTEAVERLVSASSRSMADVHPVG